MLRSLPVFKAVERCQRWTLFRRGEMVPCHAPSPEQAEQGMLLRRLETLERRLAQQLVQQQSELEQLRAQLRVQKDLLDRLLRISAPGP